MVLVRKYFASRDVNSILNCVVDQRFEEALSEAEDVDLRLSALSEEEKSQLFREKPFLGIPFTTKDWFTVRGLSWSSGLLARKHVKVRQRGKAQSQIFLTKGEEDAPVVAAMKEAGGIMLGVTNVSELCMWMESDNKVYGRTSNPYHTGRTVGGSSGGEGCVVSAGGSPWGIGSDVGGSIRIPAFFNGIFGHKPSAGIVDNSGHVPQARGIINNVYLGWWLLVLIRSGLIITFQGPGPCVAMLRTSLPCWPSWLEREPRSSSWSDRSV